MPHDVLSPEEPVVGKHVKSEQEQLVADRPSIKDWTDLRLGWWGFVRKNLDEPMPPGVGWWQTLGNLLMTLLAFQFVTGLALAMFYSPGTESAYLSVKHINEGHPVGLFVRGLHVWGSTLIVCVTVAHVLRVFFWGSYKKPRELTWVVGVMIFNVILGFSFTGYLLPWDQKAFWATTVGTRIAGTLPVVGQGLMTLIRGGEEVGALTLTRFYAIHIMVLPAALMGFTALHLYLVRRHHIAGPVVPQKGEPVKFYPNQLFKDAIVVLLGVGILAYMSLSMPPSLEAIADPTGADFAPRPEWYFLGMYELLKIMPAGWEVLATAVIPGFVTVGMLLVPWIDRAKSRHPAYRHWTIVAGTAVILMIGIMTLKGILETPPEHKAAHAAEKVSVGTPEVTPVPRLESGR
ncbi:MAG: cytochrome bc complex cytochrome b subunit [Armatimonadetes bacterium]|nr:cytochrome bc complex cytochrome b subunit [Armatimonadota bacterium]